MNYHDFSLEGHLDPCRASHPQVYCRVTTLELSQIHRKTPATDSKDEALCENG